MSPYIPGTAELVEAAGAGEDDEPDIRIAEDGELPGLLHEPAAPLGEGHLPVGPVVDPLDRDLPSPHIHLSISLSRCLGRRDLQREDGLNNTCREVQMMLPSKGRCLIRKQVGNKKIFRPAVVAVRPPASGDYCLLATPRSEI